MEIRNATLKDTALLKELYNELRAFEFSLLPKKARELQEYWHPKRTVSEVRKFLRSNKNAAFIAWENAKPAGCVSVKYYDTIEGGAREGQLDGLYVAEGFRDRKVGTKLLQAAYAWFRGKKCRLAMLWVYSFNSLARGFYKKQGFTEVAQALRRKI